jgi:hypothetical protein
MATQTIRPETVEALPLHVLTIEAEKATVGGLFGVHGPCDDAGETPARDGRRS